jgi:hypothetical protein
VAQKSTTNSDGGFLVPRRSTSNSAGELTVFIDPMLLLMTILKQHEKGSGAYKRGFKKAEF